MSNVSVLYSPLLLWNLYIEYLWDYQRGSWVQRIASTFRILAFFVITPFVILTLLDVASYVIARTLGVIDATKASTGGLPASTRGGGHASEPEGMPPAIHVFGATPPQSVDDIDALATPTSSDYRDNIVEEGNLRLSGIDTFSPAPSQPPSPTASRRDLHGGRDLQPLTNLSGKVTRRKRSGTDSSSGESTEEGGSPGVQMRRRGRARGASTSE